MTQWADVRGYEGFYQVSSDGRVKRLQGHVASGNSTISIKERILACSPDASGYRCVVLSRRGVRTSTRVHRLVAIAFIPNPFNKTDVNHINGNKADNRVSNLEWNTRAENVAHEFSTGLGRVDRLRHETRSVTMKPKNGGMPMSFSSILEASDVTGIDPTSICKCCQGKRKTAGTFEWEYSNGGMNNAYFANC